MKRKLLRASIVALILLLVLAIPVLASYSATITVTESAGNSYTQLPIIDTMGISSMVTSGFISSTGLDTRVKYGTSELPHMLADDKLLFVSDITANTSKQFTLTTGNTALTSYPIVLGYGGYITIADSTDLEPHDNFALTISLYLKDSGTYVVKEDALEFYYNASTQKLYAYIGDSETPSLTLEADNIAAGEHTIRISTDSGYTETMMEPLGGRSGSWAAGTWYGQPWGSDLFTTSDLTDEYRHQEVISADVTISNMTIKLNTAPGAGQNYTFTLRKNGVDTALTTTISNTDTSGTDTSHSVSFSQGDKISIKGVGSGSAATVTIMYFWAECHAAQPSTVILSTIPCTPRTDSTPNYYALSGGISGQSYPTSYTQYRNIIPTNGAIKDLTISSVRGGTYYPGVGKSHTATLYVNDNPTSLTATLSDTNLVAYDNSHSADVSAGDIVYWKIDHTGTPSGEPLSIGCVFKPDIDGETPMMNTMSSSDTAWCYATVMGNLGSQSGSTSRHNMFMEGTIKKLWVYSSVETGANYRIMLNDDDGITGDDFTTLGLTLSGHLGYDTSNEVLVSDYDEICLAIYYTFSDAVHSLVYYSPNLSSNPTMNLYVDDIGTSVDTEFMTIPVPDNNNPWLMYPNPYFNYIKLETGN